jgi:hypothetical protein
MVTTRKPSTHAKNMDEVHSSAKCHLGYRLKEETLFTIMRLDASISRYQDVVVYKMPASHK